MQLSGLDLTPLRQAMKDDPDVREFIVRDSKALGSPSRDMLVREALHARGIFSNSGPTRSIYRDSSSFAFTGSALLLEISSAPVASALAKNGAFLNNPFARIRHSYRSSAKRVWADWETVEKDARLMHRVHERIGDAAMQTDSLKWVWAAMTSSVLNHARWLSSHSQSAQEDVYQEYKRVAYTVGLKPHDLPATLKDYEGYVEETLDSVELTDDSHRLARSILAALPAVGTDTWGETPHGRSVLSTITSAMIPQPLKSAYNERLPAQLRLNEPTPSELLSSLRWVRRYGAGDIHRGYAAEARQRIRTFFDEKGREEHMTGIRHALTADL
ncbi:MAG: oxygenase MpaB family protein [Myxococcota bacterium]